jgi:SAM-dependent methyltransferase
MAGTEDFSEFRALERAGWTADGKGEAYDRFMGATTSQVAEPMLRGVGAEAGLTLLDVACGPGYVAGAAAEMGLTVTGVDFSASMLARAAERVPGASFREGDAEDLAFDQGTFDAVVCAFGMLHFGSPERAMAEACRVLKPGGRYAFSVWRVPPPGSYMALVGGAIRAHGDPTAGAPPAPNFFRYAEADEGAAALAEAGFEDVERIEAPIEIIVPADQVIEAVYSAGVRTTAILEAQSAEARERIHAKIVAAAQANAVDGIARLPMPAVVYAGRKAG